MLRSSKAAVLTAGSVSVLLGIVEWGYRQTIPGVSYWSLREALMHLLIGVALLVSYKCRLSIRLLLARIVAVAYGFLFCATIFFPSRVSVIMGWPTHVVVYWITFALAFLLLFSSFPAKRGAEKKRELSTAHTHSEM